MIFSITIVHVKRKTLTFSLSLELNTDDRKRGEGGKKVPLSYQFFPNIPFFWSQSLFSFHLICFHSHPSESIYFVIPSFVPSLFYHWGFIKQLKLRAWGGGRNCIFIALISKCCFFASWRMILHCISPPHLSFSLPTDLQNFILLRYLWF